MTRKQLAEAIYEIESAKGFITCPKSYYVESLLKGRGFMKAQKKAELQAWYERLMAEAN